jgi:hypothetical protein
VEISGLVVVDFYFLAFLPGIERFEGDLAGLCCRCIFDVARCNSKSVQAKYFENGFTFWL